jgi:hypothetical protein
MSEVLERAWRDCAEKQVHNIVIVFKKSLFMDKVHEILTELECEFDDFSWSNLGRNGFVGVRIAMKSGEIQPLNEEDTRDAISTVLDVLSKGQKREKPIVSFGLNLITYC